MKTVITNQHARELIRWDELTPKEQKEFDYLDTEERQMDAEFFRYKGWVYDLGEFMRCEHRADEPVFMAQWSGYHADSFFSGILIKLVNDYESVVVATYIA